MSVTLNHSLWLKMPSPSALSDCLGVAACCDIGQVLLCCGAALCIAGCFSASLVSALHASWDEQSSRGCLRAAAVREAEDSPVPWLPWRPSAVPASSHSVSTTRVLWAPAATLRHAGPTSHAQPASYHSSTGDSAARVRRAARGQCHWFPFLFVKRRTVLRTGFCTTFRVALVGL